MIEIKHGKKLLKTFATFKDLDKCLTRKPILENSFKNTLAKENKEYIDSQISITDKGEYLLTFYYR